MDSDQERSLGVVQASPVGIYVSFPTWGPEADWVCLLFQHQL